ncbi:MAG: DNA alkylation repair protein [Parcubacteria group bacterium]
MLKELRSLKNPKKARELTRFFKCGKGEYGEGDQLWGIMVPFQRQVAKKYFQDADLQDAQKLLNSPVHEQRLTGLLMLVFKFEKADEKLRKEIYKFYLKNTKRINNWDLVDLTAPRIVGEFLLDKDRKILYRLAKSKNLWERRIAVLATFMFIRECDFKDALKIAEILLNDNHDLIHKAVGWMLREIGKRNIKTEEKFLQKYYRTMPRTILRYAIEKFPEKKRADYLKG